MITTYICMIPCKFHKPGLTKNIKLYCSTLLSWIYCESTAIDISSVCTSQILNLFIIPIITLAWIDQGILDCTCFAHAYSTCTLLIAEFALFYTFFIIFVFFALLSRHCLIKASLPQYDLYPTQANGLPWLKWHFLQ